MKTHQKADVVVFDGAVYYFHGFESLPDLLRDVAEYLEDNGWANEDTFVTVSFNDDYCRWNAAVGRRTG